MFYKQGKLQQGYCVCDSACISMQPKSNLYVSACLSIHVCAGLHGCMTPFNLFIQCI